MSYYNNIVQHQANAGIQWMNIIDRPLQKLSSDLCGLFCIYIAHYVFSVMYPLVPFIHEEMLLKFLKHLF